MKDYCKKNDLNIGEFVEECIYNEVYKESNKSYTLKITCDNFKDIQLIIHNYLNKDNICWLNVKNGNIFKKEPEDRENIIKYIGDSRIDAQIIVTYYKDTFPKNKSIIESIQKIGNIEPKNIEIEMISNIDDHIPNRNKKHTIDKLFDQVYDDMELNKQIIKSRKNRYIDFYDKIDKEINCIVKDNKSYEEIQDEIIQNLKSKYNIEDNDDLHNDMKNYLSKKYKPVSYHILDEIEEDGKKKLKFKKIDD